MDTVTKLKGSNVIDHWIDNIYYDGGYIAMDIILTTDIGRFDVKQMLYCDALYPEELLVSYRPGFGDVLKEMIIKKYDDHEITFTPS